MSKSKDIEIKSHDLLKNKSILNNLIRFSIPTLFLMLATTSVAVVDSLMIVRFTSDYYAAYGALDTTFSVGGALVSYIIPFISIFSSFLFIIIIGTTIMYSNYLGKGETKKAQDLLQQSFVSNIIFSFAMMIIVFLIALPYTNYIVNSSEFFNMNHDFFVSEMNHYIFITGFTFLFAILNQTYLRIIRVEGKINQASLISLFPILTNIIFDYLFMGVANLGITGAAYATLISSVFVTVIFFLYSSKLIKNQKTHISYNFKHFKFNFKVIVPLLFIGSAAILRRFLGSVDQLMLMFTTTNLNPIVGNSQEIWANFFNASIRLNSMFMVSALAIAQGSSQLMSYYHGEKSHDKVLKTAKLSILFILIVQVILFLIILSLTPYLLNLFGVNNIWNDSNLRKILWISYFFISLGFLFESFIFVPNSYFSSTNKPKNVIVLVIITRLIIYTTLIATFWFIYQNTAMSQSPQYFFVFVTVNGILSALITIPYTFFYAKRQAAKEILNQELISNSSIVDDSETNSLIKEIEEFDESIKEYKDY